MIEKFHQEPTPQLKDEDRVVNQFNQQIGNKVEEIIAAIKSGKERLDLNEEELITLGVMRSFSQDPVERELLLDEFKNRPNDRFSDRALTSLAVWRDHAQEVRIKTKTDWTNFMTYPQHVSPWVKNKLDEISLLIDIPDGLDKYSKMAEFLRIAEDNGLLTKNEHQKIRTDLAKNL